MRIKTLFKSDELVIQKVTIKIGDCQTSIFRKIILIDGEGNPTLIVTEHKEEPVELLREKKLAKLFEKKHQKII